MHGDVKLPPPPVVMGHEMSGEVLECGSDIAQLTPYDLQPGTRVVVPFIIPCGACHFCNKGKEDLCENFVKFNRSYTAHQPRTSTPTPTQHPLFSHSLPTSCA